MAWNPGQTLQNGEYRIERKLGWGRFAITYLAKDENGNLLVIKTLDETLLKQLNPKDRNSLESKFYDEALKLERCKHPHIVQVLRTFKEGELFCIAMEYIAGDTLAALAQRVLPEKEALGYIRQVGEALMEVHHHRLLHRDVKPDNIMVRAGQYETVLIDFGLAGEFNHPLTSRWKDEEFAPIELNSTKGTRGAATDIYSLAATLYYLLTGQKPARAMDRRDGTASLSPPKTINPRISEAVNHAIVKGMELQAEARPQTMEEWLKLLGLTLDPGSVITASEKEMELGNNLGGCSGYCRSISSHCGVNRVFETALIPFSRSDSFYPTQLTSNSE
jgi:serine/threonine-protein kinase